AVADERPFFAEVIAQRVANLIVKKLQKLLAGVDQIELAAEVAKHRGIFAADDAGAVDRDRPGRERQIENRVAVEDARVIKIDIGWTIGAAADGDDEELGREAFDRPFGLADLDRVRIDEAGLPGVNRDTVFLVEVP